MPAYEPARYMPIHDLLAVSFGSHRSICVLKFSSDESGKRTDPLPQTICVSGCLASKDNWCEFGTDWYAVVEKEGKGRHPFHMAPFEARENGYEDFTDDDQNILRARLIEVINKHVPVIYAVVASTSTASPVSPEQDPYLTCVEYCSTFVASEAARVSETEVVEMFFEHNKETKAHTAKLYGELRDRPGIYAHLGPDAYPKKNELIQLQAPDYCAWSVRNEYRRYFLNPSAPKHVSLIGLMEHRKCTVEIAPDFAFFIFRKQ